MTLVELAIAFLLTGILCTVVVSATNHLVQDGVNSSRRVNLAAEEQLTLDTITRQIEAGIELPPPAAANACIAGSVAEPSPPATDAAIVYASGNEIKFYSALNSVESGIGPEYIDLKLVASSLVETTCAATLASGGVWNYAGTASSQTLATDVDSAHGALFSYLNNGTAVATPQSQAAGGTGNIDEVGINLWMDPNGKGGSLAVQYTTTVHILNVDYTNGIP